MLWLRLFLPFAGGYFLSYLYRTANAVIGPVLTRELALGAGSLGLLTGAYFLAFAAAQLPLGMLLDRFGARRVESALLLVAASGAASFAMADSIGELAVARGMIGLGVSACLMAALKAFALWFPLERQASLTGWIMTSGGSVRSPRRRRWKLPCSKPAGARSSWRWPASPWRFPSGCS